MANVHCSTCDTDRRGFLKLLGRSGLALGAMGLTLSNRLFLQEAHGVSPTNAHYDACLQVFMDGGPSQTDTWDPKPGSANNVFNTIDLGARDAYGRSIRISEVFPGLANAVQNDPAVAMGLIRSVTHGNGDHSRAQRYLNGFWEGAPSDLYPSTAAVMAYYFEQNSGLGIPSVVIAGANGDGSNTARLSKVPTALRIDAGNPGQNPVVRALKKPDGVDEARYKKRKALIDRLNARYLADHPEGVAEAYRKATEQATDITLKGKAPQAFDLTGVPLVPARDNGTARRLTQAARLIEFGVPYVACGIGGNDTHENNMGTVRLNWGQSIDQGLLEVVNRLKATGKRVLVLVGGEFGRTPNTVANGRDGRDHWPDGFSWATLSVNQPRFRTSAIGDTGPDGMFREADGTLVDPIHPRDIGAFVYRSMGFDVGRDAKVHIPLVDRDASPVDKVNDGEKLLKTFGLI